MPTPQHDSAENKLTDCMPASAEGVCDIRQTHADAHTAIRRDNFEYDVKDRVINRIALELASLRDGDEEDGKNDPPYVVSQLTTKLLADKVTPRLCGSSLVCQSPLEATKDPLTTSLPLFCLRVISVDA